MIQWKKIILSTIAAIGIACFAGGTADAASVKIDEKTFPNACVRTFANKQDTNHDGELSDAEIKAVTKLDWNGAKSVYIWSYFRNGNRFYRNGDFYKS